MTDTPNAPALTHDSMLAAIRAKCVEANQEIVTHAFPENQKDIARCLKCHETWYGPGWTLAVPCNRPIRLADVMLAIQSADRPMHVNQFGFFWNTVDAVLPGCPKWNLFRDSLDAQDDATLEFLYSLLCTKP